GDIALLRPCAGSAGRCREPGWAGLTRRFRLRRGGRLVGGRLVGRLLCLAARLVGLLIGGRLRAAGRLLIGLLLVGRGGSFLRGGGRRLVARLLVRILLVSRLLLVARRSERGGVEVPGVSLGLPGRRLLAVRWRR